MSFVDEILKRHKEPESKKIHDELFQTTSEYKYYTYGVAQGMYFVYSTVNEYNKKGITLTNIELMQVIKSCASTNEKSNGHFIRMLMDIEIK